MNGADQLEYLEPGEDLHRWAVWIGYVFTGDLVARGMFLLWVKGLGVG